MHPRRIVVKLLQRARLNKLAHRVYYRYLHGFDTSNPAVLDAQRRCFEAAVELGVADDGDYLEFGLFKGYSFWHAQRLADRLGLGRMRFFGFDSFAGLPSVEGPDRTKHDEFYEGQYACSRERVTRNLDAAGVAWERTHLIEGFYADSLVDELKSRYAMRRAAVVLVDCDLYMSTRDVLRFLDGLLRHDTVLMMDDWNCFGGAEDRGQRRALREFLEARPRYAVDELMPYGAWGQVFLVREPARSGAGQPSAGSISAA